jgi:hypothetical protein
VPEHVTEVYQRLVYLQQAAGAEEENHGGVDSSAALYIINISIEVQRTFEEIAMKPSVRYAVLLTFATLATMLLLGGCASIGMGRAKEASATVQGVADDYQVAQLQTAATQEALDGLTISPDPDLKQAFDYFSANKEKMDQVGKRLITHSDGMFYRGTFYFVESGKSLEACAFPRTGRTDDQRSIDLGEDFDAISLAGGGVKRAYRAFQLDIELIYSYLSSNLTPVGIDTMDLMLRKAKVDSDSLQLALRQAFRAVDHAKTALAREAAKKG